MVGLVFALLFALVQAWPEQGQVISTVDKTADFASVKTYAWEKGQEVFNREAHKMIADAIHAELAALGISEASDKASADVIVRYDGLASTYVDLEALERARRKDPTSVPPTKALGSLAISMHRNKSTGQMWRGHARDVVDLAPSAREASIRTIVARVFATYPKRPTP